MKPASFAYAAPETIEEAVGLLDEHGEDAKILAGGQSLMPMLNFRLARPALLVDVNRLGALATLRRREGALRIGALTREAALERSSLVARHWPLLREAVRYVGHPAIRNRGTVGGSAAHGDPAAELPVALAALDARFHVRSATGTRTLDAEVFFVGHLTTAVGADELLAEIEVPLEDPGAGSAFAEYARSHGDFALAGAAAVVVTDEEGRCQRARIALLGAGATPVRAVAAEEALRGAAVDEEAARHAGALAARDSDPPSPQNHRRALIAELTRRAVAGAVHRAAPGASA